MSRKHPTAQETIDIDGILGCSKLLCAHGTIERRRRSLLELLELRLDGLQEDNLISLSVSLHALANSVSPLAMQSRCRRKGAR
eukprot:747531-Hanusia_phi.AAC.1